jgi:hypothetical protein
LKGVDGDDSPLAPFWQGVFFLAGTWMESTDADHRHVAMPNSSIHPLRPSGGLVAGLRLCAIFAPMFLASFHRFWAPVFGHNGLDSENLSGNKNSCLTLPGKSDIIHHNNRTVERL